jgi:hypothetical protein
MAAAAPCLRCTARAKLALWAARALLFLNPMVGLCAPNFDCRRRDLPASQNFLILSQHVYLFVYNNMGYMNIIFANFFPLKYQCEICLFQNFEI